MHRLIPLALVLWLAPVPAAATSHWYPCIEEPTFECLIGHAADEAALVPYREQRAFAIVLVAGAQAIGGKTEAALINAEDALALGEILGDTEYEFLVTQIILARAWAGELDTANNMLGWLSDPWALALGYGALAEAQARWGQGGRAVLSLSWAMEEAARVSEDRASLVPWLAISHARAGEATAAHALVAEARQLADKADSAFGRTLPVTAGAVAAALAGHTGEFEELLAEAERRLAQVEDETGIGILAAHIAWALAVSGDAEGARGVIRQLGQLNLALLTYHHRAQILAYAALALARVE